MFSISPIASAACSSDVADDHRNLGQTGLLTGTPAALASDDLVARASLARLGQRTHHDRLDHALGNDRVGQLAQRVRIEIATRLIAPALDVLQRQMGDLLGHLNRWGRTRPLDRAPPAGARAAPEQGIQSAAQALLLVGRGFLFAIHSLSVQAAC